VSVLSAHVIAKATRLAEQGCVVPVGPADMFEVRGDHGTYEVVVGADRTWCNCAARGTCSHIAAAVMLHLREQRDPPVRPARHRQSNATQPAVLIQPEEF
jgi:uncharacterized Zn finger protein